MALTINNFWGAETGTLDEVASTTGTPTVQTSTTHSGDYSYLVNTANQINLAPYSSVARAGDGLVAGFWFYYSSTTKNTTISPFFKGNPNETGQSLTLSCDHASMYIFDAPASVAGSASWVIPKQTWFFVEVYWEETNSGDASVYVDGELVVSVTAQDFIGAAGTAT